jgi:hypothetical protein
MLGTVSSLIAELGDILRLHNGVKAELVGQIW